MMMITPCLSFVYARSAYAAARRYTRVEAEARCCLYKRELPYYAICAAEARAYAIARDAPRRYAKICAHYSASVRHCARDDACALSMKISTERIDTRSKTSRPEHDVYVDAQYSRACRDGVDDDITRRCAARAAALCAFF